MTTKTYGGLIVAKITVTAPAINPRPILARIVVIEDKNEQ